MSLRPLAIAVICCATAVAAQPALAQSVEDFYRGKTVTMVIGYPPAGANDVYARMVARHIGKHIPGNPSVVPRNMPGAGSLIAANHVFNVAPRDGTVLSLLVPTLPLEKRRSAPRRSNSNRPASIGSAAWPERPTSPSSIPPRR